jgi:hypothetical protein
VGRSLVTVCTTKAEPWVNASVTDESLTGLREGGLTTGYASGRCVVGGGLVACADAGVTNDLPSGTEGGPVGTSGGEAL